jgi:hypothetical protein
MLLPPLDLDLVFLFVVFLRHTDGRFILIVEINSILTALCLLLAKDLGPRRWEGSAPYFEGFVFHF